MNHPERPNWISRSYGKINLGLQVLDRLPNGYHSIATGFCFIEWSDRFSVSPADKLNLELNEETIPTDESNLIIKAMRHLKRYANFDDNMEIDVEKYIPHSAGLGGGSSNAATILRIINKISDLNLTSDDLADLAGGLGADIPFFIHAKPGIAEGIGTDITPTPIQPDAWIVTVYPNEKSSTKNAYQYCTPNPNPEFDLTRILTEEPIDEWRYMLTNDLEQSVIPQIPVVGDIKDQLYELGAVYASMSGSGSAVYGLFDQEMAAADAINLFLEHDYPANLTPPNFQPDLGIYLTS